MTEYAGNLYDKKYIIGYTGLLNDDPTVYFKNGNKFGHITQCYDESEGIGRELALSHPTYEMRISQEDRTLQECMHDRILHESRTFFVAVNDSNREVLAQSLIKHKQLKPNQNRNAIQAQLIGSNPEGRYTSNNLTVLAAANFVRESYKESQALSLSFRRKKVCRIS